MSMKKSAGNAKETGAEISKRPPKGVQEGDC